MKIHFLSCIVKCCSVMWQFPDAMAVLIPALSYLHPVMYCRVYAPFIIYHVTRVSKLIRHQVKYPPYIDYTDSFSLLMQKLVCI